MKKWILVLMMVSQIGCASLAHTEPGDIPEGRKILSKILLGIGSGMRQSSRELVIPQTRYCTSVSNGPNSSFMTCN